MKILISVALVVALFNEFHCAPARDDDGYYGERHSFNSWGRHYGGDFNLGLHGGFKDGIASLGTTNHIDFGADGYDGTDARDVYYAIRAQPAPSYSGNQHNPAYSSPYTEHTPQYGPQYSLKHSQQNSQNGPGFGQQYGSQYPQYPQRAPPRSRRPQQNRHQRREEEEYDEESEE